MSGNICPITGRPIQQTQTVHEAALQKLAAALADLPDLMGCLTDAVGKRLNRQGWAGPINTSGLPIDPEVAAVAWGIRQTILIWTDEAVNYLTGRDTQHWTPTPDTWPLVQFFWTNNAAKLTTWPDADRAIPQLIDAIELITKTVDKPPMRQFLGTCAECGHAIYHKTGHGSYATECTQCGAHFNYAQSRLDMMEKLSGAWLRSDLAIQAVRLLTGKEIKASTLRKWRARRKVYSRMVDGHRLYQPAHIIQALEDDTPKKNLKILDKCHTMVSRSVGVYPEETTRGRT